MIADGSAHIECDSSLVLPTPKLPGDVLPATVAEWLGLVNDSGLVKYSIRVFGVKNTNC